MAIPKHRKSIVYRQLKRHEAEKLGVKYSSKFMVRADLKRVTKRTKTISNRQAANKKISRLSIDTGQKARTKEAYTKSRAPKFVELKKGGRAATYGNLNKRELMALIKKNRGRKVVLIIHADRGGKYVNQGAVWTHGVSQIDADEIINPVAFEKYLRDSDIRSKPDRYGLEVLAE